MNYSKQRNLIYETLCGVKTHPTVEEIFNSVKKIQDKISLSTVYRNLEQLHSEGLILKLEIPGEVERYDANISKHYHAKCNSCNKIIDIYTECTNDLNNNIQKDTGMEILSHEITFNVICSDCNKIRRN